MKNPIITIVCAAAATAAVYVATAEPPKTESKKEKSVSEEKDTKTAATSSKDAVEVATFGAGCFWCVEAVLERIKGIKDVTSGYMGGHLNNPTYEQVCGKQTGHAEVVQVKFDPKVVTYEKLVKLFWELHDPTTLNRQGNDIGPQYRSAIYYHSPEQKKIAEKSKKETDASGKFDDPIVTEITKASTYYIAEDYHQDFYENNPSNRYCRALIPPKLKKLGLLRKGE